MNKGERQVRALLKDHPDVKLETDNGGFVLVGPNRKRRRIGSLKGRHSMRHIEQWIAQMSGATQGAPIERKGPE